jgi:hypothetical protein
MNKLLESLSRKPLQFKTVIALNYRDNNNYTGIAKRNIKKNRIWRIWLRPIFQAYNYKTFAEISLTNKKLR